MTQEITLTLDESRVQFIKEFARQKGKTVSEIVDGYLELLQKADAAYKRENINSHVATVSGIVRKRETADAHEN